MKLTMVASVSLMASVTTGCLVSMPDTDQMYADSHNVSEVKKSAFDGEISIRVDAMSCGRVGFNLFQNKAQSDSGFVLLGAGPMGIDNVGDGQSLELKIDGDITKFTPVDKHTNHTKNHLGYGVMVDFSYRTFRLQNDFVRKIANAKDIRARVHLLNNQYVDGVCVVTDDTSEYKAYSESLAIHGFKKFVTLMDQNFR